MDLINVLCVFKGTKRKLDVYLLHVVIDSYFLFDHQDFIRYSTRAGEDCSSLEKTLNMLLFVIKAIEDQQLLNNIYSAPEDVKSLGTILRHVSACILIDD